MKPKPEPTKIPDGPARLDADLQRQRGEAARQNRNELVLFALIWISAIVVIVALERCRSW